MRVSVLLPTTGSLNQVLSIDERRDLTASQVNHTRHWMPLTISGDYHALTRSGGLLGELGAPFHSGVYQLQLTSPIESGNSWELPVVLAHLVVALGGQLVETPAKDDIVLWATGKVDGNHDIDRCDYRLQAKAECSREGLQEAVTAGARIVALVPACENAAPLRAVLKEIGAHEAVVETVASVEAACDVVRRQLGRTPDSPGRRLALAARTLAASALMLVVFVVGRNVIPQLKGPGNATQGGPSNGTSIEVQREQVPPPTPAVTHDPVPAESLQPQVPEQNAAGRRKGPNIPSQVAAASAPAPAPPPAPVKLQEFRAPNDRKCDDYFFDRRMPPHTDVVPEGPDRFPDSPGRNLCILEWTLNPEARGVQGFDIVDPPRGSGIRLSGDGPAGAWTKVSIQFAKEITRVPITYTVKLKFNGPPPPDQAQQFRHTIK